MYGPSPTLEEYAFTTPYTSFKYLAPMPVPVQTPPTQGLEEVTNG